MTITSASTPTEDTRGLLRHLQAIWASTMGQVDFASVRAGRTFEFPGTGTYTFLLPDTTYVVSGNWAVIEINGPNAAGASTHDADLHRVRLEVDTLFHRFGTPPAGSVVLRCYSPDSNLRAEILTRVGIFAQVLEARTGGVVQTMASGAQPRADALNVVHGDIPSLTTDLNLDGGELRWKGAPVLMVFNANVLAQLARHTGRALSEVLAELDPGTTHEGIPITRLVFDKGAQQDLFAGSAIRPLEHVRVRSIEDAAVRAVEMAARFGAAFIKPDASSGGVLALPVDATHSVDRVLSNLRPEVELMTAKYGPGWELTCPLNVFEFAHGRPAVLDGREHRWDLRWAIHARPESTEITPLLARCCPEPIGPEVTRENAVCNVTRRAQGHVTMLSPRELVDAAGIEESTFAIGADGLYRGLCNAVAQAPAS